jgi:hypothetical protein
MDHCTVVGPDSRSCFQAPQLINVTSGVPYLPSTTYSFEVPLHRVLPPTLLTLWLHQIVILSSHYTIAQKSYDGINNDGTLVCRLLAHYSLHTSLHTANTDNLSFIIMHMSVCKKVKGLREPSLST